MLLRSRKPKAPLCDVVEGFRMYENYAARHQRGENAPERHVRAGVQSAGRRAADLCYLKDPAGNLVELFQPARR
jgi:hypothetical protein